MRNKHLLKIALLIVAALNGCQEKGLDIVNGSGSRIIKPILSSVAGTKAEVEDADGRRIAAIPISEDPDDSLYLIIYEKDIPNPGMDASVTKGSEVTDNTLFSFKMKAYAEDDWVDNETGINHQKGGYFGATAVNKDASTGEWNMATEYNWLNDVPLSFWSWNEVEPTVDPAKGYDKAFFSYTVADAVTSQKDLIFAYNGENREFDNTGVISAKTSTNPAYRRTDNEVDVHFYHALSTIMFDVSGVQDGQTVDQITIGGVASSGDCEITVSGGVPDFDWDNLGTSKNYSQAFGASDFASTGRQVAGGNKEFLMIPQVLTDDATLTVTFNGTASSPKSIKAGGVEWKAGKYYTYKISKTAYEWDYTFDLTWDEYLFNNNKTSSSSKTNSIDSYRTRQDDPSVKEYVNWKIKSYKIGGGEEVTVDATTFDYSPAWIKASTSHQSTALSGNLYITAKEADKLAKGQHGYWVNESGRTDDLEWSPADWSGQGSLDLSKIDVYGDSPANAHGMTTSNCYIVRHTGTYMLPLVYGNAMDGGNNNSHSYCTEGMTIGTKRLGRFLNHKGVGITSPFIENNTGCIAKSCEILWQSDANVLSGLDFTSAPPSSTGGFTKDNVRYLKFSVDKSTVQQSNALIAIKDGDGKIIWSWHIWITNDPDVIGEPIEVTNYIGQKYYFIAADNVGSVSAAEYPHRDDIVVTLQQDAPSNKTLIMTIKQKDYLADTHSLMYEWGRKDPFLKDNNDYAGNTCFTYKKVEGNTIAAGILEPMTWFGFSNSPSYTWATLYANLWTGIKSEYIEHTTTVCFEQDNTTIKTIYDPSPVGYMVPPIGAFSGFDTKVGSHVANSQTTDWNVLDSKFDHGYIFYTSLGEDHKANTTGPTIFFAADGIRAGEGAAFIEKRGWYYSSTHSASGHAVASFQIDDDSVTSFNYANPANGHSVRPILEKPKP